MLVKKILLNTTLPPKTGNKTEIKIQDTTNINQTQPQIKQPESRKKQGRTVNTSHAQIKILVLAMQFSKNKSETTKTHKEPNQTGKAPNRLQLPQSGRDKKR
jgi:hypothetical protein